MRPCTSALTQGHARPGLWSCKCGASGGDGITRFCPQVLPCSSTHKGGLAWDSLIPKPSKVCVTETRKIKKTQPVPQPAERNGSLEVPTA